MDRKVKEAIAESVVSRDPKEFLEERYPFLLIDRIVGEEEKRLTAVKNLSANEAFFEGHFPGMPVMPGVLIMESLAQASGVLLGKIARNPAKHYALTGCDRMRFRRPVVPGDQLVLEVELVDFDGTTGKLKCIAKVADQVAASGDLTLTLEEEG